MVVTYRRTLNTAHISAGAYQNVTSAVQSTKTMFAPLAALFCTDTLKTVVPTVITICLYCLTLKFWPPPIGVICSATCLVRSQPYFSVQERHFYRKGGITKQHIDISAMWWWVIPPFWFFCYFIVWLNRVSSLHAVFNSTQLNLLIYGSCEAGLNKHREHIIKHKA